MSKYRFQLNRQGVSALMKSEAMRGILNNKADQMLNRLGEGYDKNTHIGHTRANVNVFADSYKSKRENYKHNTILKAVK